MAKLYTDTLSYTFGALTDPTRRAILSFLQTHPGCSVSDLAGELPLKLPGITKHLDVLARAKLVERKKTGRVVSLKLRAALSVLGLSRLGQRDGFVLGLEENLLLFRAGLRDQALPVRAGSGLAAEREGTADQQGHAEADETSDEGGKAHDDGVGHLKFLSVWREREDARRVGADAPVIA